MLQTATNLKRSFSTKQAAEYVGCSASLLNHLRIEGYAKDGMAGPKFIRIGRSVRYLREDLDAWLEQFERFQTIAQENAANDEYLGEG